MESREFIKTMLLECQVIAESRYPQLVWGDLVFHADEVSLDASNEEHGTIHLHSSFVPVCYQNKQGPDVQVAFERCLREMGFNSFSEWKHDLDNIMEEVLHNYSMERTYMGNHEKHQNSTQWHRQQDEIRRTKELENEALCAKQRLNSIDLAIHTRLADLDNRIQHFGAESIEETINNPGGIYDNILFLAANCDDDRFDELDREGRELKEHMLYEAMDQARDPIKMGLDQTIANITSGKKKLTWEERQRLWELYNETSKDFWKFRADIQRDLQLHLDASYRKYRENERMYYDTLYFLHKNRSFLVLLIGAIFLLYSIDKQKKLSADIAEAKKQQKLLSLETSSFARFSRTYRDDLKAGRIPCEKCLDKMTDIVNNLDYEYQQFCSQNRNTPEIFKRHYFR